MNRRANDFVFISLVGLTVLWLGLEKLLSPTLLSEDRRIENIQALILLTAVVLFCIRLARVESKYLFLLIFLIVSAGFLFLEEISYGQRIIGFQTPKYFAHNLQGELNLHNYQATQVLFSLSICLLLGIGGYCLYVQRSITVGQFVIVPFLSRVKWIFVMTVAGTYLFVTIRAGVYTRETTEPNMYYMYLLYYAVETLETLIYVFLAYLSCSRFKNW